ncbi:uncharacterized protein N7459_009778 [Penicillium hispanicum]|uniref:uncharacterized protein n=1 Tax=Penicillium hispanicum TaxID=1080232 RepID=UPI002541EF6B|nr:uncharacterized protein N7459_009778 [Penicillium hispanicum]KAJ5570348.1 hypothetical protein N7459_009778 [Penicillium hispanicum]
MPRLPTALLIEAYREDPLLPLILKECRTLGSARNELRWLREHALRDSHSRSQLPAGSTLGWRTRLRFMCHQRSQGMPLQYIIGDQPFGDLEILCRRGVLIPRPETESYTYQAARLARQLAPVRIEEPKPPRQAKSLRILDLCTGTGCIALLLHSLLAPHFERLRILGVDKSATALRLAQKNVNHNRQCGLLGRRASTEVQFHGADILRQGEVEQIISQTLSTDKRFDETSRGTSECDLLISNPPYISDSEFRNGTTARSVRLFEPRHALVPPTSHLLPLVGRPEDIFFHRILNLSLWTRAKITVLECGDLMQARRVIEMYNTMASRDGFAAEIWPSSEYDLATNGFHPHDGSRCVIIRRYI